jgi:hypothetical protein
MTSAVLVAAGLLLAPPVPVSVDFGSVQLGGASVQRLNVRALHASASGAGFSATATGRGVVVVFEPYELREVAKGTLRLGLSSGTVRIALRGRGIDTIPPVVTVETPRTARVGRTLTIRFAASDNDLVRSCTVEVGGRVVARLTWPVSSYRWRVPGGLRGRVRVTVVAVDRAGNRAVVTSRPFAVNRRRTSSYAASRRMDTRASAPSTAPMPTSQSVSTPIVRHGLVS